MTLKREDIESIYVLKTHWIDQVFLLLHELKTWWRGPEVSRLSFISKRIPWHEAIPRSIIQLRLIVRLQHQPKMDVRKVRPILCSSTECFPVADIWIISLDPLNLLFYKLVVCRRYSLPLLGRSIHNPFLSGLVSGWSHCWNLVVAFGRGTQINSVLGWCATWSLMMMNILPWQWLKSCCHIHGP